MRNHLEMHPLKGKRRLTKTIFPAVYTKHCRAQVVQDYVRQLTRIAFLKTPRTLQNAYAIRFSSQSDSRTLEAGFRCGLKVVQDYVRQQYCLRAHSVQRMAVWRCDASRQQHTNRIPTAYQQHTNSIHNSILYLPHSRGNLCGGGNGQQRWLPHVINK